MRDDLLERKSAYCAIVACSGAHEYGGVKVSEASLNNDADTIQRAFANYDRTTILADEPDPETLHDLQAALDADQVYATPQLEALVTLYLDGADHVHKLIAEDIPSRVAADTAYQNAKKYSDKPNARIEHDKALTRVMTAVLKDDTELFKLFMDNESFRRWLTDTVFGLTYESSEGTASELNEAEGHQRPHS
jgi:hypothetical protein